MADDLAKPTDGGTHEPVVTLASKVFSPITPFVPPKAPCPTCATQPGVTLPTMGPPHPPTSPPPVPPMVPTTSTPTVTRSSLLDQELGKVRQDLLKRIPSPSSPVAAPSNQPPPSTLPRAALRPAPSLAAPRELRWSQLGVGYLNMRPFTRPMINGGLSGKMWGEEVPPVFFRPDDCGNPLGKMFIGRKSKFPGGPDIIYECDVYERCIKYRKYTAKGVPKEGESLENYKDKPVGDEVQVPNNTPGADDSGGLVIAPGVKTRIYDLAISSDPAAPLKDGVSPLNRAAYFKVIEVDGCKGDVNFIQLIRIHQESPEEKFKPPKIRDTETFGWDTADSLPDTTPGETGDHLAAPFAVTDDAENGTATFDDPGIRLEGPDAALVSSAGTHFKMTFYFLTFVYCDADLLGVWEWSFTLEFDVGNEGEFTNSKVVGGAPSFAAPGTAKFNEDNGHLQSLQPK